MGVIRINHFLKVVRVHMITWNYRRVLITRVKEIDINYETPALISWGIFI
jgi:hypothetical protein